MLIEFQVVFVKLKPVILMYMLALSGTVLTRHQHYCCHFFIY